MTDNPADPPADQPAERLAEFLRRELRTAGKEAKSDGATAEEVTADLTERLKKLRRLNAEGWPARRPANGSD
jgi:hypothetical protein